MTWGVVAQIIGSLLGSGGIAWIVTSIARRRTAPFDNAARLSDAAMVQVDQLQEQVKEARVEANECRLETSEARRQVRRLAADVDVLANRLHMLTLAIHDPGVTIERLRRMVPISPSVNGGEQ
jgi:hypothetical protein